MSKNTLFNLISLILFACASVYAILLINDNPITWQINEAFVWVVPLFFIVAAGFLIASNRIQSNIFVIILAVISIIAFVITLLLITYVIGIAGAFAH